MEDIHLYFGLWTESMLNDAVSYLYYDLHPHYNVRLGSQAFLIIMESIAVQMVIVRFNKARRSFGQNVIQHWALLDVESVSGCICNIFRRDSQ